MTARGNAGGVPVNWSDATTKRITVSFSDTGGTISNETVSYSASSGSVTIAFTKGVASDPITVLKKN